MRINKYLADTNRASRRESDTLIKDGKIFINGKKALLGQQVTDADTIEIRGKEKNYVYYAYNKPVGIVTSTPTTGETDIIHHIRFPEKVFPIGRLDKDSYGLIIMTNDGRITKKMLDPEYDHEKEYEVSVDKAITPDFLEEMSSGVRIDLKKEKYTTKPCKVKKLSSKKFSIILTEGKNRQIRRMCEALGYTVEDLKRIRIGKIMLGNLKQGEYKKIDVVL